jgi:hypothetical protein
MGRIFFSGQFTDNPSLVILLNILDKQFVTNQYQSRQLVREKLT